MRAALAALDEPATVEQMAAAFVDAPPERVLDVLEMLAGLAQVQADSEGGQETRFL